MATALVRQGIRQCGGIDRALLDENLTERAAHLEQRVSDLAGCHIFFAVQVVEISNEPGGSIRPGKNTLAIAADVDILRCPLGGSLEHSPTGNVVVTVCRT